MDDTAKERARCVKVVDLAMLEAPPEAQRALTRVRNMINSGAEPMTFREQVESDLEELRQAAEQEQQ